MAAVERVTVGGSSRTAAQLAYFLGRAGRTEEAEAILAGLLEEARRSGGDAWFVAMAYAGLGRADDAFEWLGRAVDDRSLSFEFREGYLVALEGDPRFEQVLQEIGIEER